MPVLVQPAQVQFLTSVQVPVLRVGARVDPRHQARRMKHLDQQPGAVDSHTVEVLSVLVGCAEPMPGLGQHRVTL
ncbi:hypothetical protein D3C71_1836840 [compost metagenome]